MTTDNRAKVLDFIKRELARGHDDVDVESDSLIDTGIIDSLGIMKLVEFLDKELKVAISDDELVPDNFETLDDICTLISSKLA